MTTTDDLAALMARVAQHDRTAFEALYRATSAKLFGIALRILARRDLAEEALQDVYVKVWERAREFDASRGSPIAWMATMTRNRALDDARRKRMISVDEMPASFDPAEDSPDPLQVCQRSEGLRRLLACLDALEPKSRDMLLLAYYQGATRESLALRFNAPVGTVKTRLRRSLASLRTCLST